jgi:WhiB family transcriptional regulator, redox-sensing transcriptional regulator
MIGDICASDGETSTRRPEHWSEYAACKGLSLTVFFGPPIDTPRGMGREPARVRDVREQDAIAVCRRCPVIGQCLAEELKRSYDCQFGVFGGTTEQERKSMIEQARERPRAARRPRARSGE